MSIVIRGMEMPDNCFHCSFCRNDLSSPSRLYVDCTATDNTIIECDYEDSEEAWEKLHNARQEWCPLVEIEDGRFFVVKDNDLYRAEFTWPESNIIIIPEHLKEQYEYCDRADFVKMTLTEIKGICELTHALNGDVKHE